MAQSAADITLRVVTPAGVAAEVGCDSVRLVQCDDASGRGGGSVGILRGHVPAVIGLGSGRITALTDGRPVFSAEADSGFASVQDNVVTVITDNAVIG